MAIKAEFQRINNVVVMTILEQGDEIDRFNENETFFEDTLNNVTLKSNLMPGLELDEDLGIILFVQGDDRTSDLHSACWECADVTEADAIIGRCGNAIDAYNSYVNDMQEKVTTVNTTPKVRIVG